MFEALDKLLETSTEPVVEPEIPSMELYEATFILADANHDMFLEAASGSTIENIANAIMTLIKKVIKAITDFFNKVFKREDVQKALTTSKESSDEPKEPFMASEALRDLLAGKSPFNENSASGTAIRGLKRIHLRFIKKMDENMGNTNMQYKDNKGQRDGLAKSILNDIRAEKFTEFFDEAFNPGDDGDTFKIEKFSKIDEKQFTKMFTKTLKEFETLVNQSKKDMKKADYEEYYIMVSGEYVKVINKINKLKVDLFDEYLRAVKHFS